MLRMNLFTYRNLLKWLIDPYQSLPLETVPVSVGPSKKNSFHYSEQYLTAAIVKDKKLLDRRSSQRKVEIIA